MKPVFQLFAEMLGCALVDGSCGARFHDPVKRFQLGAEAAPAPVSTGGG